MSNLYIGNRYYIRVMLTTIQVRSETKQRLVNIGKKGESYDTVINRILDTEARAPPHPKGWGLRAVTKMNHAKN